MASRSPVTGWGPLWSGVVRSEWTKVRSVRSSVFSLLIALVATVGISAAITGANVARYGQTGRPIALDPAFLSVSGVFLAELAIGVFGVLVVSAEYSTGMVRTAVAAVPQRRLLICAKAVVFSLVVFAVSIVSTFVSFFVGQVILSQDSLQTTISSPGSLRVVIGAALYLLVVGLFGLGLGAILRRTAGAIATLFGMLLVLPALAAALPSPWDNDVSKYLPQPAGTALLHVTHQPPALAPWVGFGVFCGYAVASLALALFLVHRRDV